MEVDDDKTQYRRLGGGSAPSKGTSAGSSPTVTGVTGSDVGTLTTGTSSTGTPHTGAGSRGGGTGTPHTGAQTGPTGTPHTGTGTGSGTSGWSDPTAWTQTPAVMLQSGSVINNRFILEECIGRGGMGTVFKARDLRKEEAQDRNPYVAIKVLNEDFRRRPDSLDRKRVG